MAQITARQLVLALASLLLFLVFFTQISSVPTNTVANVVEQAKAQLPFKPAVPTNATDGPLRIMITEDGAAHDEVVAALLQAWGDYPNANITIFQAHPNRFGSLAVYKNMGISNPYEVMQNKMLPLWSTKNPAPDILIATTCEMVPFPKIKYLLDHHETHLFCVIHHADRWHANWFFLNLQNKLAPWMRKDRVDFIALSGHTAYTLAKKSMASWAFIRKEKIRPRVHVLPPVFRIPPPPPLDEANDKISYALQGNYEPERRDYAKVFRELQHAKQILAIENGEEIPVANNASEFSITTVSTSSTSSGSSEVNSAMSTSILATMSTTSTLTAFSSSATSSTSSTEASLSSSTTITSIQTSTSIETSTSAKISTSTETSTSAETSATELAATTPIEETEAAEDSLAGEPDMEEENIDESAGTFEEATETVEQIDENVEESSENSKEPALTLEQYLKNLAELEQASESAASDGEGSLLTLEQYAKKLAEMEQNSGSAASDQEGSLLTLEQYAKNLAELEHNSESSASALADSAEDAASNSEQTNEEPEPDHLSNEEPGPDDTPADDEPEDNLSNDDTVPPGENSPDSSFVNEFMSAEGATSDTKPRHARRTVPSSSLSLHLVGSGIYRPTVPPDLKKSVFFDADLNYTAFYSTLSHTTALIPGFADRDYFTTKASSSVPASLIAGSPLIATRRLLHAYTYLSEECVWLQSDDETEFDVLSRIVKLSFEERRKVVERVKACNLALVQANRESVQKWTDEALEKRRARTLLATSVEVDGVKEESKQGVKTKEKEKEKAKTGGKKAKGKGNSRLGGH